MRRTPVFASILLAALIVAGCSSSGNGTPTSGRQLKVVAAENFWGNLVQQIGGNHVSVTSLISNPNADPHEFTSNTTDELDVSQAGLVIVNGAGYDDFMSRLLSAAPSSQRRVLTIADVLHVSGSDPNPHLWYDAPRIPKVVNAIATSLGQADPADKDAYAAGAHATIAALVPLEKAVVALRKSDHGDAVAYTERVPGYLLAAAGLKVVTPPGFAKSIEDGTDPSFADTAAMRNVITAHQTKVLLYNSQAVSTVTKQLRSLAASNGVPVVPVSETMPLGDTFESWQLSQVKALTAALASGK